jgi:phosphocarrier protein HPr
MPWLMHGMSNMHAAQQVSISEETSLSASREIEVRHKIGLHARPAALFVKTASGFSSRIMVENLTKGTAAVSAKSILSVLLVAVQMDDRVCITADGNDEEAAVTALCDLIYSNFGE